MGTIPLHELHLRNHANFTTGLMSSSNSPSSQEQGGIQDEDSNLKAIHDQMLDLEDRLKNSGTATESAPTDSHESQVQLEALSSRSARPFDTEEESRTAELQSRLKNLALETDLITKESNLISRRPNNKDSVDSDLVRCPIFSPYILFFTSD